MNRREAKYYFDEGWFAYKYSFGRWENPYDPSSDKSNAWKAGYDMADKLMNEGEIVNK